ncbi:hypothetical protein BG003_004501 [Podila horticola]|nr:hypothetical protein BG003_004501 [Podila horticola]
MTASNATVVQEEPAKDPKGKDGSGSRRKRPHVESSDSEESSSNDDDNDQKQRPRVYGSLYTGDHEWGRPILPLRRAWIRSKEWTSSRTRRIKVKEKELEDRRLSQCTKRIYATSLVDWEEFCDDCHGGDYLINTLKLDQFLKAYMFAGGLIRSATCKKPYRGAIGRMKNDPLLNPQEAKVEEAEIRARFAAALLSSSDDILHFRMPLSEKTIQATINTLAAEWTLQQKTGTNRFRKPALEIGGQIMMGYRRSLLQCEKFPDFLDKEWLGIKLMRDCDRYHPLCSQSLARAIRRAFKPNGVHRYSVASGKASARRELHKMGVDTVSAARVERNGAEIPATMAIAGFNNTPLRLKRDIVPSLALQRQIFPMIEEQHGSMAPDEWRAHSQSSKNFKHAYSTLSAKSTNQLLRGAKGRTDRLAV